MKHLESRGHVRRLDVEDMPIGAPHFVTELMGISNLPEGQVAHFEAQIEPIHDPDLKVEFLHNGAPLKQGSRIHTICDFGYVALDISHLVEADAGEYSCRVSNKFGQAASSVRLSISGKDSLDTSSQRPEGLEKIAMLESGRHQRSRADDEVTTFQKPMFTQPLQNVEREEGHSAHFSTRLIPVGDPTLKVEWLKDGQVISSGEAWLYLVELISDALHN